MPVRTTLADRIPERTTPRLVFSILDEDGALASLTALTGKLYDVKTKTVIRDTFNLLPFFDAGVVDWTMAAVDTQMYSTKKDYEEQHRLLLLWSYGAAKFGAHEVDHYVTNLHFVP